MFVTNRGKRVQFAKWFKRKIEMLSGFFVYNLLLFTYLEQSVVVNTRDLSEQVQARNAQPGLDSGGTALLQRGRIRSVEFAIMTDQC